MNIQTLKEEQHRHALDIIRQDDNALDHVHLIGGADVGFEQQGTVTRAVIAVLSYPELRLVEYQVARVKTEFPYIPGYLSFRECPALLKAWSQVIQQPDLIFVDGQGIAHPRYLGVASHFGLLIDKPTIGVAKKKLFGQFTPPLDFAGNATELTEKNGQQLGWVLTSKVKCHPLFVSIGHRISHKTALIWVKKCLNGYRLPEPTRWADAIASRRPLFLRWQRIYLQDNDNF